MPPPDSTLGLQFALMSAVRTGNFIIDMVVCTIIPAILGSFERLKEPLSRACWFCIKYLRGDHNYIIFSLADEQMTTNYGRAVPRVNSKERNDLLQKAVVYHLTNLEVKHKHADVQFQSIDNTRSDDSAGNTVERMKKFVSNLVPSQGSWLQIEPGLEFKQDNARSDGEETDEDRNKGNDSVQKSKLFFIFRAKNPNGEKRIRKFLSVAFEKYIDMVDKATDKGRFFYIMQKKSFAETTDDDSKVGPAYKRYKLSEEKDFTTLFFKEKPMLLKILENFEMKKGKYGIKGYPHKFGLLLHGPPGTGKTSLIKALAAHTKRSIVTIPLSRIETNQQLMDIMMDQSYNVIGEELPIKMNFKETIFVMEDVDAASNIVHSREAKRKKRKKKKMTTAAKRAESDAEGLEGPVNEGDGSAGAGATNQSKEGSGDGESLIEEKPEGEEVTDHQGDNFEAHGVDDDDDDDDDEEVGGSGGKNIMANVLEMMGVGMATGAPSSGEGKDDAVVVHDSSSKDKVDLSGLLNVLDGIVDTPGRIFVMTSNHPEKLDSALIRPGRVDKILHLSYMGPDEATEMVEHYFQCVLTAEQDQKLSKLLSYGLAKGPDGGQGVSAADPTDFANYKNHERAVAEAAARANTKGKVVFTPAELEQMCAEHDTIDEFLTALNNRVGIFELHEELVRPGNSRQISLSNQDVIDTLGTQLAGKGVLQARPLTRDGMGGLKRQISL